MTDDILPLISIPNDANESDIWLVLGNGQKIKASEAMIKFPLLKTLVQKNLKLMASDSTATVRDPQSWIVTYERQNYASLSFYCSKDNFNRDTSASIVFAEGQAKKFEELISRIELPPSLGQLRAQMARMVKDFSFMQHLTKKSINPDVKKKTSFLIVSAVLLVMLAAIICLTLQN